MNIKYIFSFLLIVFLGAINQYTVAQDQVYGLINMSSGMSNSAYTGWNNKWTAGIHYQNYDIGNKPNNATSLYGEYNKGVHAGGVNILSDSYGIITTRKIMANYAYHYCKEKYGVRLGAGLGFAQKEIDFTGLKFGDQIVPGVGIVKDTLSLSLSSVRSFGLVNLGAVGYYKNIYLSFAAHNVNNPNQSFYHSTAPGSYLPVRYHVQLGGYIPVSKNFVIYPNIRYNQQKQLNMLMPEVQLAYKNFVVGGSKIFSINAENINKFNFNAGFTIKQKFKMGYMFSYYKYSLIILKTHEISFVYMMNTKNSACGENALNKYMRRFL